MAVPKFPLVLFQAIKTFSFPLNLQYLLLWFIKSTVFLLLCPNSGEMLLRFIDFTLLLFHGKVLDCSIKSYILIYT